VTFGSDQELLSTWAAGSATGRVRRPLALLEHALGTDAAALGQWPLGRRDAALIDVLIDAFGGAVEATADCAACGEEMEVAFAAGAIRAEYASGEPVDAGEGLVVRALTTDDVAEAVRAGRDESAVARVLAARCAGVDGQVDEAALDAIGAALEGLDPQADVRIAIACPDCGHEGEAGFDVAAYVWRLVEARARELIAEVDALARAYGWREADVLALPRERRELYLEMVGA
jgi:uncharacterized protein (UPF0212 family)